MSSSPDPVCSRSLVVREVLTGNMAMKLNWFFFFFL